MQLTRQLDSAGRISRCRLSDLALLALALLLQRRGEAARDNTLARVQQTGTLKLGYYADARPFSHQDERASQRAMRFRYVSRLPMTKERVGHLTI